MDGKGLQNKSKKKKYQDFEDIQLQKAIIEVKTKGTSLRKAAKKFGVSKSTLNRHLNNKNTGKVGRPYVFDKESEEIIAECIALAADWGFPLITLDIRLIVKAYLDRQGVVESRFTNNMPGRDWVRTFVKRHTNILTKRLCQNVKRSRANVNADTVNLYFDELETTLKNVEPHLIINYDETNLTDDPGRKNVIVRRGCRHPERIVDSSKQSTSVMFAAAADGTLLPPYIVYKSENLYDSWCENGPKGTLYNRSKSGWFTMDIFEEWFKTIILPYCKKYVDHPKVLIGDNLTSHLSPWVINECIKNKIRFVLLPPNSTGICQPLDVAFFKPLKVKWRSILDEWKSKNRGSISKDRFPRFLNQCLISMGQEKTGNNVKSGFKGAGIFPLDRHQVLKRLPTSNKKPCASTDASSTTSSGSNHSLLINSFQTYLEGARKSETEPLRKRTSKKKIDVTPGKSVAQEMLNENFTEAVIQEQNGVPSTSTSTKKKKNMPVKESSDDSSEDYSVHDFSDELCFSSSENELHLEDTPQENLKNVLHSSNVQLEKLSVGVFVVIGMKYDEGTKKETVKNFIGQIISMNDNNGGEVEVKFLRRSSEAFNVYIFPTVEDIMTISYSQVVDEVKPLHVSRGRYTFPYEIN